MTFLPVAAAYLFYKVISSRFFKKVEMRTSEENAA